MYFLLFVCFEKRGNAVFVDEDDFVDFMCYFCCVKCVKECVHVVFNIIKCFHAKRNECVVRAKRSANPVGVCLIAPVIVYFVKYGRVCFCF